jgi:hypothetical protein
MLVDDVSMKLSDRITLVSKQSIPLRQRLLRHLALDGAVGYSSTTVAVSTRFSWIGDWGLVLSQS